DPIRLRITIAVLAIHQRPPVDPQLDRPPPFLFAKTALTSSKSIQSHREESSIVPLFLQHQSPHRLNEVPVSSCQLLLQQPALSPTRRPLRPFVSVERQQR